MKEITKLKIITVLIALGIFAYAWSVLAWLGDTSKVPIMAGGLFVALIGWLWWH